MVWLIEPIAAETNAHSPKTAQSGTQLSSYKVPKRIEFRTLLPKTNVGKILRRALRDEMWPVKKQDSGASFLTGSIHPCHSNARAYSLGLGDFYSRLLPL